jgi:predicted  nucleic acid-binding Zn-ribbon protein
VAGQFLGYVCPLSTQPCGIGAAAVNYFKMKITLQLADDLAELSRLHEASRQHPRDIEVQVNYQELRCLIPRELLAVFDSRRRSGRRAFAPLVAGACGACLLPQPMTRQFGLSAGDLVTCHGCGVAFFDPLFSEDNAIPVR